MYGGSEEVGMEVVLVVLLRDTFSAGCGEEGNGWRRGKERDLVKSFEAEMVRKSGV